MRQTPGTLPLWVCLVAMVLGACGESPEGTPGGHQEERLPMTKRRVAPLVSPALAASPAELEAFSSTNADALAPETEAGRNAWAAGVGAHHKAAGREPGASVEAAQAVAAYTELLGKSLARRAEEGRPTPLSSAEGEELQQVSRYWTLRARRD